jgi:hypothetical protein
MKFIRSNFFGRRTCDLSLHSSTRASPQAGASRHWLDILAIALCVAVIAVALSSIAFRSSAHAAELPLIDRGTAVITTFSGTAPSAESVGGEHPRDKTLIDPAGPVLRVLDLTAIDSAPSGQFVDLADKLKVSAGDIGQVFGVVLAPPAPDAAPDIYAAATSLFGLQIVKPNKDGKVMRLVRGAADARWAPGQFGLDRGGSPGTIWKIDGTTGDASAFATIRSGVQDNAGPGLGAIAYDPVARQLFVSSLETGMIHRLDLKGAEIGVFDHGLAGRGALSLPAVLDDPTARMDIHDPAFSVEDPSTWGLADKKRRVTALAVEGGRLYYGVAEGPSLWSVGLLADGSASDDARLEIDVKGTPDNNPITGIAFDGPERVYLTQRGDTVGSYDYAALARPRTSVVYRYVRDKAAQSWREQADEYAVGMPSPHRATNGGAALSYGHDDTGRVAFGQCRATLWTTGEGLRANPQGNYVDGVQGVDTAAAQAASASRAATGSQALQGDFGVYDSDLAPPAESWFIPIGSRIRGGHGQVGAIAIHAPCEDAIASAPEPERLPVGPVSPVPPIPDAPGLHISKVCHPGPLGGVIRCTITLTNVGWTLTGPVGFTDASTVLAGPDTGSAVLISSAVPDGPDWICSPTPTSLFSCQLAFAGLLPGQSRSVEVRVDTGPLVATGNTGFRNCASLALPWAGTQCVDHKTQIVVKKTAPASCLPGGACTFDLSVTNSGSLPFAGDVLLSDSLFVDGGGAPVAAPIAAIAPSLGCAPDPVVLPFSCEAPLTLAAGETKTFSITATMPALPPNYWGHNCFSASAPGQPAPALPPGPGTDPNAVSCAWVPVGAPPPLVNLQIGKSALDCHKQGADTVRCHYDITLKNTGPSPSIAPITFTETIPASSTLASIGAPWSCVGGPPLYTCTTPAAPIIAPGDILTIPVDIDLDRAPLEAAKCWAPNHVLIMAPAGGTPANFLVIDDSALATADAAWIRFDEGGPLELVLCDPTNLQTTKVADGPCAADGDGYRCGYTVTVTNMGPDPFTGRIDVTDTFSTAPIGVTFPADWDCGGGGANWTCSRGPFELPKGDSVSLKLIAKLPATSQCVLSNRATMIFPPANTRWNLSGADDSATAFSSIPSPECEKTPQCESPAEGESRTVSGACACAAGHARDRKGRCVEVAEEVEPEPPTGTPQCGLNEYRTGSGECACDSGFSRRDGRCVPVTVTPEPPVVNPPVVDPPLCVLGPNEVRLARNRCVCRDGFSRNRAGRCEPDIVLCTPGRNEHRTQANRCVCDSGYERDGAGRCVPVKPEACPSGTTGKPPNCKPKVCGDGMTGKWPDCRPITCPSGTVGKPPNCKKVDPPKCPSGTTGIPPNCKKVEPPKCPSGTVGKPPNCRKVEPPKCPSGTVGKPPNCKKVDPPKCPAGMTGRPPNCKKLVVPCKTGEFRDANGRCVKRKVETPPKVILKKAVTPPPQRQVTPRLGQ